VAAPCLGKTPQQGARRRLEVQHTAVDAAAAKPRDVLRKRGQRRAARIDAQRDAVVARLGEKIDHLEEQLRGQIVDAVIAAVLEHVERDGLARARQPADQD
jgi:hypothetical protein